MRLLPAFSLLSLGLLAAGGGDTVIDDQGALGYPLAIVPDVNGCGADETAPATYNGDERGYTNYGAVWIWLGE